MTGLILNPDKTEILVFNTSMMDEHTDNIKVKVKYFENTYTVECCDMTKVNGVYISSNKQKMRSKNFCELVAKIKKQLLGWTKKGLTLLGRIQIYKTFGMSQILYQGSVVNFSKEE